MKIINEANLTYREVGKIIDQIQDTFKGETMYVGKTDDYSVWFEGRKIRITIRYLKSYTEWGFYEEE